jgi:hypothetical protein
MRIKLTLDELLSMGPGVWVDLSEDGEHNVNVGLTLNPKILDKINKQLEIVE